MLGLMEILADLRAKSLAHIEKHGRGTQAALARAANIHVVTFIAFLKGRRGLSLDTAVHLATALGLELKLGKPRRTR